MLPNTDMTLVILFLVINLGIGLWYGKGVVSMQDYALGGRKFSTAVLAVTIIATWIGGSSFFNGLSETYRGGIFRLLSPLGPIISLLITAYILAPRMQEFLGKLSVAEAMGDLYGVHVRVITAISSIAFSTTIIAMQIKVFSIIFNYFFGINSDYATLVGTVIIITYSAFGGIKSVIFTDVFQFLTFGAFVPTLALLIWSIFGNWNSIVNTLTTNPTFNPKFLLDYHNPVVLSYYSLFFLYLIPFIDPATFQRILIAKTTEQASSSIKASTILYIVFCIFSAIISIVTISIAPNIQANDALMYIIDNFSSPGFKGLIIIGMAAMIMSTADSYINSSSIIFVNDILKPLGISGYSKIVELKFVRAFAIFIGFAAFIITLSKQNMFRIFLLVEVFISP